ncbi:prepilin-type N-terminal cleavage/methylation domain-containing protein [Gilliamella apis]|uniref:prepilin-type N-terminal cleavage/methylation domain-containing protein n=1 Tax=Gilliamella apis TaxID=1970738 RepID=UPI00242ACEF9|nr:prepilin-type N-terminal cleavage/methylation domain-containing protein [Gilliamella apis]
MQNSGFSLLELLFVISISAILAAIGVQHWQELQLRNELATTTKQLAYFLEEAQARAYNTNENYHVYYFFQPWCLSISKGEKPPTCEEGTTYFMKPNNSVELSDLTDKKAISFWGRKNMAQTGTIELHNAIGTTKIIISYRGRIRFCKKNSYLPGLPRC